MNQSLYDVSYFLLIFQIRLKIYDMLPESATLALRLCCKQLKWDIDHLVGLQIRVCIDNDFESDCKNLEWIKQILIRELTIRHRDGNLTLSSPWISFLTNGGFNNLNRLSLSGLNLKGEGDLASILTGLSTLRSLCELNLSIEFEFEPGYSQDHSISAISTPTENFYNFQNLTTLNLDCSVTSTGHFRGEGITTLNSFQKIYCPQLKYLSVKLDMRYCKTQTCIFWYLELVEKFSNSLQYLGIDFLSSEQPSDWETSRLKAEEKALEVGSQLKNLKEVDIVFNEPKEISV